MVLKPLWIWLSLSAVVLLALTGLAGVFLPGTYARETLSWAAQGRGQDLANLIVVVPAMLAALHFAFRGSARATLVAFGLLIYTVYSSILYAFFVHFGPWFPAYVAVLGLSAWALGGALLGVDRAAVARMLTGNPGLRFARVLLFVLALLFSVQWLGQIVPAVLAGGTPKDLRETGLFVNPVHVLDLAFILPGMIAAAVGLRRRRPLALLFTAPLLAFSTVMGVAILFMFGAESARGAEISAVPGAVLGFVVLLSGLALWKFLRGVEA